MREETFTPVVLARIVRPWGRRGEVAAEIFTDFPERLAAMPEVWIAKPGSAPRLVKIVSCRMHLGQAVLHFEGVETISDAERLRGFEVQIRLEDRLPAGSDRHYVTDLIGCEIWEEGAPASLGVVQDVQQAGVAESWFLVAATPAGELLIPLAAEICTRIDTAARRIEVRLPNGLRELNAT